MRGLHCAGTVVAALGTVTACGGAPEQCEPIDVVPQVGVTWQADALSHGPQAAYHLCVETHCTSGAPRVCGDLVRVTVRSPKVTSGLRG